MDTKTECHFAALNLFAALNTDLRPEASPNNRFIIRTIFGTEKCEEFDLRRVREATAKELRTRAGTANLDDARMSEAACAHVVAKHREWCVSEVRRALPWSTRWCYFVNDHTSLAKIAIALVSGAYGVCVTRSAAAGVASFYVTGISLRILETENEKLA